MTSPRDLAGAASQRAGQEFRRLVAVGVAPAVALVLADAAIRARRNSQARARAARDRAAQADTPSTPR